MKLPKIICISLPRHEFRKNFIREQANKLGIDIVIMDGIDGKRLKLQSEGIKLMKGEIGAGISHFCALTAASLMDGNEFLILDDDAVFCEDFIIQYEMFYKSLPTDWQIAYLGFVKSVDDSVDIGLEQVNSCVGVFKSISTENLSKFILTNHAYLIKKETIPLLTNAIYPFTLPIDIAFIQRVIPSLKYYVSTPCIVNQATIMNEIHKDPKYKGWLSSTSAESESDNENMYIDYGFYKLETLQSYQCWKWTGKKFKISLKDGISNIKLKFNSPVENKIKLKTGTTELAQDVIIGDNEILMNNVNGNYLEAELLTTFNPSITTPGSTDTRELGICLKSVDIELDGVKFQSNMNDLREKFNINTIEMKKLLKSSEMKKLGVLFVPRCGSHWIMSQLNEYEGIYSNTKEIFNLHESCIDKLLYDKIHKAYNLSDEYSQKNLVKLYELNKDYKLKYLKALQSVVCDDYKIFAYKFQKGEMPSELKMMVDNLDYVIISYRKNILYQWISNEIAKKTNIWQKYEPSENNITKIIWDKSNFINFRDETIKAINEYKLLCKDKPHVFVSYEEIHEKFLTDTQKSEVLQDKLLKLHMEGVTLKRKPDFKNLYYKQSNYNHILEYFENPEKFSKFNDIKLFMLTM